MTDVLAAIALLLAGAAFGAVLMWRFIEPAPAEIVRTDTVEVAAARPEPPRRPRPEPETRIVYETRVDTVRDCFRVPTDFKAHGVMEQRPLSVTPSEVTIEYWQPDASRFEQAVYSVPRPRWDLYTETAAALMPVGMLLSPRLGLTHKWGRRSEITGWGGLSAVIPGPIGPEHLALGWAAGATYRFTIIEW